MVQEKLGSVPATHDKEVEEKISELLTMQASYRNVLRPVNQKL